MKREIITVHAGGSVFQHNQQRDKLSNIVLKIGTDTTVILYDYYEITHFNPT